MRSDSRLSASEIPRQDLRIKSAQAIAAALFEEISDLLPSDVFEEIRIRIFMTIFDNGVLLIRDGDRAALGLEPCDALGWTPSERRQLEILKAEALTKMLTIPAVDYGGPGQPSDADDVGRRTDRSES